MNTRAMYVLAGFVFGLTLVAVVVLRLNDQPVDDVITLAGPVITGLFVVGILGRHLEETKAKVETVEQQTNGMLDQRFARHAAVAAEQAATKALERVGATGPAASPPSTSTMPSGFLGSGEPGK